MQPRSKLFLATLVLTALPVFAFSAERAQRRFEFTYTCDVTDLPSDATRVDIWMPVPVNTQGQTVERVEIVRPESGKIRTEPEYGNRIFHNRFAGPFRDGVKIGAELVFDVTRQEVVVPEAKSLAPSTGGDVPDDMAVYLAPNRMIPIDGKVAKIAAELKLSNDDPLATARKIYDYLIDTMEYNWKAEGAGRGDVRWACDSKTGDCTDYHSTFIALCRATGIPADHQFGFPVRTKNPTGKIPYNHCWARFWVKDVGWIPADISEADKHPELLAYNFGSLTADQLKMSHGRDVTLVPPQEGEPLNMFVYPYVEVDGEPYEAIKWSMTFKDLEKQ